MNPRIRPIMVGGKAHYVLVLHPYQVYSLRTATSGNYWTYIQSQAASRGAENPIFTGALGVYNGVVLRESEFVPRAEAAAAWSVALANDNVGLFFGAQAMAFAMGNAYDKADTRSRLRGLLQVGRAGARLRSQQGRGRRGLLRHPGEHVQLEAVRHDPHRHQRRSAALGRSAEHGRNGVEAAVNQMTPFPLLQRKSKATASLQQIANEFLMSCRLATHTAARLEPAPAY